MPTQFEFKFVTPPIPTDMTVYGLERLYLVPRFNRDTYYKATGEQPPPYDKGKQIKRWKITPEPGADLDRIIVIEGFDIWQKKWCRKLMTLRDAADINLPGAFVYPKYEIAPTSAVTINVFTGETHTINPENICLKEDADALMKELGGKEVIEGSGILLNFAVDWKTETRRQWLIEYKGEYISASRLLYLKNRDGVGAPGYWNLDAPASQLTWVGTAQPTEPKDLTAEVLIPMRPLAPNEEIIPPVTPFSPYMVSQIKSAPVSAGILTPEQDKMLREIHAAVTRNS